MLNLFKSNYQRNLEIYQEYYDSCTAVNTRTIDTTYATYRYNMMYFFNWLKDNGDYYILNKRFVKKCAEVMEHYIAYCKTVRGNSNQTLHKKITAVSSFYIWALRRNLVDRHPTNLILRRPTVTQQDKIRKSYFLTIEQIHQIFDTMEEENWSNRDKLIFSLLLDTGMRINALYNLKIEQLDMDEMCFMNVHEKMGKVIDYVFFERTKKYLENYLEERSSLLEETDTETDWLLITNYGGIRHMSKETIRERVRKIGKIVGIKNFYPHSIRKTSINLVSKAMGIEVASEFANHEKTDTTKTHYVQPKSPAEKRKDILEARKKLNI